MQGDRFRPEDNPDHTRNVRAVKQFVAARTLLATPQTYRSPPHPGSARTPPGAGITPSCRMPRVRRE